VGGDTCYGNINETAPACITGNCNFTDRVAGSGTDLGIVVTASTAGIVAILACTPTPTNTPVNNTPTNTPTTVPTPGQITPSNPVPTLNEAGMLILGLLLAGAGYLLLRKAQG
jgi:hypothetical protein